MSTVAEQVYAACCTVFNRSFDPVRTTQIESMNECFQVWAELSQGEDVQIFCKMSDEHPDSFTLQTEKEPSGISTQLNSGLSSSDETTLTAYLPKLRAAIPYPPVDLWYWFFQDDAPAAIVGYKRSTTTYGLELHINAAENALLPQWLTALSPAVFWRLRSSGVMQLIDNRRIVDLYPLSNQRGPILPDFRVWCGDQHMSPPAAIHANLGTDLNTKKQFPSVTEQKRMIEHAQKSVAERTPVPQQLKWFCS